MGRLIDEDILIDSIPDLSVFEQEDFGTPDMIRLIEDAPTVQAISKADYETRLKADKIAMLTELKNELTDISWNIDMYDSDLDFECCYLNDINKVIQQKINALEAEIEPQESEAEDGNDNRTKED